MSVAIPNLLTEDRVSTTQIVDGSLKFNSAKSHYLSRTPGSAGNRRTWTWSGWVKRSALGSGGVGVLFAAYSSGTNEALIQFGTDTLRIASYISAYQVNLETSVLFRDPSAWYHVTAVFDTTNATTADRVRLYVNGLRITSFTTATYPSQNYDGVVNSTVLHVAGTDSASRYFSGSLANVHFIDGQALDPSSFGYTDPLTNTWRPKKVNNSLFFAETILVGTPSYPSSFTTTGNKTSDQTGLSFVAWSGSYLGAVTKIFKTSTDSVFNLYVSLSGGTTDRYLWYSDDLINWTYVANMNPNISYTLSGHKYYATSEGSASTTLSAGTDGTNSFYLPMDGNTPIGQDRSGNNKNWTPVNFGGSNTIEKATGALPILNTDGGGKVARVGVRTDSNASSLVLALPLVGIKSDFSNAINSGTSNKVVTANGNAAASSTQSNFYGGSFYFDGSGDYLSLADSTDFNFGSGDFTIELWVYSTSSNGNILHGSNPINELTFASGALNFGLSGSFSSALGATVPTNKWAHVSLVRNGTTITGYVDGVAGTSPYTIGTNTVSFTTGTGTLIGRNHLSAGTASYYTGYIQDFRVYKGTAKYTQNFIPASTDPDILPDTPSGVAYSSNVALVPSTDGAVAFDGSGDYLSTSASSSDFTFGTGDFTVEGWFYQLDTTERGVFQISDTAGGLKATATGVISLQYNGGENRYKIYAGGVSTGGAANGRLIGWVHFAVVRSSGTTKLYLNGSEHISLSDSTNYSTTYLCVGGYYDTSYLWNGFISNLHVVKGTALYTSNFTPPTGPLTATENTKLLCCKSQTSATAYDVSPGTITSVNAIASNFNPFTANINAVRGQESGYCTLNPLFLPAGGTLSNGNLDATLIGATSSDNRDWAVGTISNSSGKWYYEMTAVSYSGGSGITRIRCGIFNPSEIVTDVRFGTVFFVGDGKIQEDNVNVVTGLPALNAGDIVGIAYDLDALMFYVYINGIFVGSASISNVSPPFVPIVANLDGLTGTANVSVNFGQKPFKFPPPAGFQPLALANTPRPTIVRPDQYVGIVTYTGNGTSQTVSGYNFKPDFIWVKSRGIANHSLTDTVRGVGKDLYSSLSQGEATDSQSITSITSNGFTVGSTGTVNPSGTGVVAWAWKAGGNSNTYNINDVGYATAEAAGLTAGTITPTGASVNTKSGFSIITYTGNKTNNQTVSHGLQNTPAFIIAKNRDVSGNNWMIYHKSFNASKDIALEFNTTSTGTVGDKWRRSLFSSTVFGLADGNQNNGSGEKIVAYCWAEIPGFSKFGKYTGNGSTDGPMIVTGFRPRWVMVKIASGATSNWQIIDTERIGSPNGILFPNLSNAEDTSSNSADILSNGFKIRVSTNGFNYNTGTYIYCAFAESPTFNLYGAQANAR